MHWEGKKVDETAGEAWMLGTQRRGGKMLLNILSAATPQGVTAPGGKALVESNTSAGTQSPVQRSALVFQLLGL